MARIEYAELRGDFKSLTLRYVKGINLNVSSMKCLKGHTDRRVHSGMTRIETMSLDESPYYYLCATDRNGIRGNELHLAFVDAPGEEILMENRLISCRITGARRIQADRRDIDTALPQASDEEFAQSPLWQFANLLASTTQIPREPMRRRPGVRFTHDERLRRKSPDKDQLKP